MNCLRPQSLAVGWQIGAKADTERNRPGNDIASVLTAAEILERCLVEVRDRSCHTPADTRYWEAFVRRLFETEELVSSSDHRSAGALIWLLDKLRHRVLTALRDDLHFTDST